MASSHRLERFNGIILRDLSLLIANKIKDDRIIGSSIGITSVNTTPDLKDATVYISVIGSDSDKDEILEALEHASGFLRKELSKGLKTYQTPALHFKLDNSYEYGNKIDQILDQLKADGQISEQLPEEEEAF